MFRFLSIVVFLVMLGSGCATTKYIPSEYFNQKHAMQVSVKNIPSPTHSEDAGGGNSGLIESAIKTTVKGSREQELREVFKHIDEEQVRKTLEDQISQKIKKFYDVNPESTDLLVAIMIKRWGWSLPTADFGIRTGSYQLDILGEVRVYDLNPTRREIAHISLLAQEIIKDRNNVEETKRAISRASDEFADLAAEFLWKSDDKKK